MPVDLLVVGLGNPGDEYARTRHNVGAEVVELLARRHGGKLHGTEGSRAQRRGAHRRQARRARDPAHVHERLRARPSAGLVRRLGVEPEQIVIVHDELDLPPAVLRVKVGGGLAGHNGLRSIKQHLHTDEFVRVRIGVGKPPSKERGADHVLSRVSKRDREAMDVTIEEAADAVELIVTDGVAGRDEPLQRPHARTGLRTARRLRTAERGRGSTLSGPPGRVRVPG